MGKRDALRVLSVSLLLIGMSWGQAASAQDGLTPREQQLLDLIKKLEKRVDDLEREVKGLKREEGDAPATAPEAEKSIEKRLARVEESLKEDLKPNRFVAYWKEGLRFDTRDGRFKLRIGGRIQNDVSFISQSRDLDFIFGDAEDGTEFRRARLYVSGDIYDNVFFKAEYDFAGGDADFNDVYLGVKGIPYVGTVRIGHQKEPFGLEELTSSKYITFMERSLTNTFVPARNTGIQVFNTAAKDRFTWALGVFRETNGFGDGAQDGGFNWTARVTGVPWYKDDGRKLLHLGLAYSRRNPDGMVRYRTRPEIHMIPTRFVDTGAFRADDIDLLGGELALVYNSFSLQGEYVTAGVTTKFGGKRDYSAHYAMASYFVTGEHRPYNLGEGAFGRVKPIRNFAFRGENKGPGAWELALRYSSIDLDDGFFFRGGKEDNITAGVNWYLNPNSRVMLNYVRGNIDHDLYDGIVEAFIMRFQVDF